jgi:hypothetical protein
MTARNGPDRLAVAGPGARLAVHAGDREEGDVGDATLAAGPDQVVVAAIGVEPVGVLDADHVGDGSGLVKVVEADVGQAEVADQASLPESGQRAEPLRD